MDLVSPIKSKILWREEKFQFSPLLLFKRRHGLRWEERVNIFAKSVWVESSNSAMVRICGQPLWPGWLFWNLKSLLSPEMKCLLIKNAVTSRGFLSTLSCSCFCGILLENLIFHKLRSSYLSYREHQNTDPIQQTYISRHHTPQISRPLPSFFQSDYCNVSDPLTVVLRYSFERRQFTEGGGWEGAIQGLIKGSYPC